MPWSHYWTPPNQVKCRRESSHHFPHALAPWQSCLLCIFPPCSLITPSITRSLILHHRTSQALARHVSNSCEPPGQVLEARGISTGLGRDVSIASLVTSLAKALPLQWIQHKSLPTKGSRQLPKPSAAVLFVQGNWLYAYSGLKYVKVKHQLYAVSGASASSTQQPVLLPRLLESAQPYSLNLGSICKVCLYFTR